jgi:hypothetical protein
MTRHDVVLWTTGAGITFCCYVYQFFLEGTVLQLFYYFSFLLPFVFLLLSMVVAGLLDSISERTKWVVAAVIVIGGVLPWVLDSYELANLGDVRLEHYVVIVIIASVLLVTAVRVPLFQPAVAVCAAAALGVMLVASFAGSGSVYANTVNSRRHPAGLEMDVYRVALQFIDSVPRMREQPGIIRFWYSNLPAGNSMQSIQSTYLWGRSKVQPEGGAGLPELSDADLRLLHNPRLKWLTLLAEKQEQLAESRAALLRTGIQHSSVARRVLMHGRYTLHLELLDIQNQ